MPDIELQCRECSSSFVFTETDQERFRLRRYEAPRRCPPCREKARTERSQRDGDDRGAKASGPGARVSTAGAAGAAGGTGADGASAGDPAAGARRERRPRPPAELHAATCSLCGAPAEVPFRPDGVRPVFCLPCLKRQTR